MTIPLSRVPSMKARKMRRLLRSLGYRQVRRTGSHVQLECPGRGGITFAFHDKATVSSRAVRQILLDQAGLTEGEMKEVLGL